MSFTYIQLKPAKNVFLFLLAMCLHWTASFGQSAVLTETTDLARLNLTLCESADTLTLRIQNTSGTNALQSPFLNVTLPATIYGLGVVQELYILGATLPTAQTMVINLDDLPASSFYEVRLLVRAGCGAQVASSLINSYSLTYVEGASLQVTSFTGSTYQAGIRVPTLQMFPVGNINLTNGTVGQVYTRSWSLTNTQLNTTLSQINFYDNLQNGLILNSITVNGIPIAFSGTAQGATVTATIVSANLPGGGLEFGESVTITETITILSCTNPNEPTEVYTWWGCFNQECQRSTIFNPIAQVPLTVTVNPSPGFFCVGNSLSLTATTGVSYLWSNGSTTNPTVVNTIGNYTVTVTNAAGCVGEGAVSTLFFPNPQPLASNGGPYCLEDTIQLIASGGISYAWSGPGGFVSSLQNPIRPGANTLMNGSYIVTVTDFNGCTAAVSTTVTVNPAPIVGATNTGSFCVGETIELQATGGISFSWSGPAGFSSTSPNPTITNGALIHDGFYEVTVTDANNCTASASTLVAVFENPSVSLSSNAPVCSGSSLNLNAAGPGNASYVWTSPGGQTYNGTAPFIPNVQSPQFEGIFNVTVTDVNNCVSVDSILIDLLDLPLVDAGLSDTVCLGQAAVLTATGGITYTWSAGGSNATTIVFPTNTSIYAVTATGSNNCTASDQVTVVVNALPTAFAGPDVTVTVGQSYAPPLPTATNGQAPYTYTWITTPSVGGNGSTQSTTTFGPFTAASTQICVNVVDLNGCEDDDCAFVNTVPCALGVNLNVAPPVMCLNNQVTLASFPTGVVGQINYTWSYTGPSLIAGFNSTIQNPGTYTLTAPGLYTFTLNVQDAATGCQASNQTTVIVYSNPVLTLTTATPYCVGNSAQVVAAGSLSQAPYTYNWILPNGATHTGSIYTFTANASTAGLYQVTVTDALGCSTTGTRTVVVNTNPISVASNSGPVCEGLQASVNVTTSGSAPYTYTWTGPGGFTSTQQSPAFSSIQTSNNGTYQVTVNAANGCSTTASTSLVVYPNPAVVASASLPRYCVGQTIVLAASGGLSYQWRAPGGLTFGGNPVSIPNANAILHQGLWQVTATNGNGCSSVGTVLVQIVNNPVVTIGNTSPVICQGLPTTMTAIPSSGAGSGYTFNWDNGLGANPVQVVSPATNTTYTVTVTDGNGCSSSNSTNVSVNLNPIAHAGPDVQVVSSNTYTPPVGVATGGTPVYTYNWSTTPAGQIGDGSPFANPVFGPFTAASTFICVTVTDVNGCIDTDCAKVDTIPCTLLVVPQLTDNSICQGSAITLTSSVVGAVGTLNFSWTATPQVPGFTGTVANPGLYVFNTPGVYTFTVTVTDNSNNCIDIGSTTLSVTPTPELVLSNGFNPYCADEAIFLDAFSSNAVGPFTFNWSGPASFSSTDQSPIRANANASFTGNYCVVISDGNGCTATDCVPVTVYDNPVLQVSNNSPLCIGNTLNLSVIGSDYYTWQAPDGATLTGAFPSRNNVTVAMGGNYQVTGTDVNGCSSTGSTNVTVNPKPTITLGGAGTYCQGTPIPLTAAGGVSYIWTTPLGSSLFGATPSIPFADPTQHTGQYCVTVTDANGCTNSACLSVVVRPNPSITASNDGSYCIGETVNLSSTSNSTSTYQWVGPGSFSSTQQTPSITNANLATAGVYCVTVTDAFSCTSTTCTNVIVHATPAITSVTNTGPYCVGDAIQLNASAPTAVAYSWTGPSGFNANQQNPNRLNAPLGFAGYYVVTITDQNTCTATDSTLVVMQVAAPITVTGDTACIGTPLSLSAVLPSGVSYSWQSPQGQLFNGQVVNIISAQPNLHGGTWTVSGTDANGCTSINSVVAVVDAVPTLTVNAPSFACSGDTIQLLVSGAQTYLWNNGLTTAQIQIAVLTNQFPSNTNWSVTATSPAGCTASRSGFVTVNPVPVVVINAAADTLCNTPVGLLLQAFSPGATYQWSAGGQVSPAITAPAAMTAITYTVTATSGTFCTATATTTVLGLGVLGCPQFPLARVDINHTKQNTAVSGQVLTNDINGTNAVRIQAPAHGFITSWNNSTGAYTYNPTPGFTGLDSLAYRTCVGLMCDTAWLYIRVWPDYGNFNPATADALLAVPGSTIVGNVLSAEPGNNAVTPINTIGNWGTLTVAADGSLNWQVAPTATAPREYLFWVESCNPDGLCDSSALWLNIMPVANTTTASDDAFVGLAHSTISGSLATNDNPSAMTYTNLDTPTGGLFSLQANGNFSFQANWGFVGAARFRYRACNGTSCDTATAYILVRPLAPIALPDNNLSLANTTTAGNVLLNDYELQGLALQVNAGTFNTAFGGSFTVQSNGNYTYQAANGFTGVDSVSYQVCNPLNACTQAWLQIAVVQPLQNTPIALNDATFVGFGSATNGNLSNNDQFGPNIYTLLQAPANGSLSLQANGDFTYTPDVDYVGLDSAAVTVCNTAGACDTSWLLCYVLADLAHNQPLKPFANTDAFAARGIIAGDLSSNDIVNTPAQTFTLLQSSLTGTLVLNADGTFNYTTTEAEQGPAWFTYRLCEASACDTAAVHLLTLPRYPYADADLNLVLESGIAVGNLAMNDDNPRATPLTYTLVQTPACGTLQLASSGHYTFNSASCTVGTTALARISVCDNWGQCDTSWLEINVTAHQARPHANNDQYRVLQGGNIQTNVLINDLDPSATGLTSTLIQGTANLNTQGQLVYAPAPSFSGKDTLLYQACDGQGICDTAAIIIDVLPAWAVEYPLAGNAVLSTIQPQAITLINPNDLAISPTGSNVTISTLGNVVGGQLVGWEFFPDTCFIGIASWNYLACDASNHCDTGTVYVAVYPALAPSVQTFTDSIIIGSSLNACYAYDNELPGAIVNIQVTSRTNNTSATLQNTTPCLLINTQSVGFDTLQVVFTDICGNVDTSLVFITVLPLTEDTLIQVPAGTSAVACIDGFSDELPGYPNLTWTIIEPGNGCVIIDDIDAQGCVTLVSSFEPCTGTVVLLACDGNWCDTTYLNLETVGFVGSPVAVDDSLDVVYQGGPVNIPALLNDTLGGPTAILAGEPIVTQYPANGIAFWDNDAQVFVYEANNEFCGQDSFRYQITNQAGNSDEAVVKISIECPGVRVYNGISPNGDGRNDVLVIEGLQPYPNNGIKIYSSGGVLVFSTENYNHNDPERSFNGTWNGVAIPDGTYYYHFYYTDELNYTRNFNSYLEIRR
jgi:gliding motility-associated-like protein